MKPFTLVVALFVLFAAACGVDVEQKPDDGDLSKTEAAAKNDGVDYCDVYNWYGDGECDVFCTQPDPDCAGGNNGSNNCGIGIPCPICPNANLETVTYFPGTQDNPSICDEDLISQTCPDGTEHFSIPECGCGCVGTAICPDPSAPDVFYLSNSDQDPTVCETLDFQCAFGQQAFSIAGCGCGCIGIVPECYDPEDPLVTYISEDPNECALIDFGCNLNETGFSDACGCGCIANPECLDPTDPTVTYIWAKAPRSATRYDSPAAIPKRRFKTRVAAVASTHHGPTSAIIRS